MWETENINRCVIVNIVVKMLTFCLEYPISYKREIHLLMFTFFCCCFDTVNIFNHFTCDKEMILCGTGNTILIYCVVNKQHHLYPLRSTIHSSTRNWIMFHALRSHDQINNIWLVDWRARTIIIFTEPNVIKWRPMLPPKVYMYRPATQPIR